MKLRILKILTLLSYFSIMFIGEKIGAPLILWLIAALYDFYKEAYIICIGIFGMVVSIIRPGFTRDFDIALLSISLAIMLAPLFLQIYHLNASNIDQKIFLITTGIFLLTAFATLRLAIIQHCKLLFNKSQFG